MFTLRYIDGQRLGEPILDSHGGPWTCQHATTARKHARSTAAEAGYSVAVIRGDHVSYVVRPSGAHEPPPGALVPERARCTAGLGDRPCFCVTCRAERRATRGPA